MSRKQTALLVIGFALALALATAVNHRLCEDMLRRTNGLVC